MTQIIEGKPQLPPGFCFICELSNPVRYWDTLRDFEGIVREKLDGRKYVCEECLAQGATALGFATQKDTEALKAALTAATDRIDELEKENEAFKDLKASLAVLTVANVKPSVTQKQPTRKPATKA